MENKNKFRPLYILKILQEHTDEKHNLTTNEIVDLLENEYGIKTHRTTIAPDIALLQEYGYDIIVIKSSQNRYYMGERSFELPEIKLLIDAVQSSRFINKPKSKILINKLSSMVSEFQKKELVRTLVVDDKIKPKNTQIYYIVDTIHEAINLKKKISFLYFDYLPTKEKHIKNDGEPYIISPYSLLWNGDYYYLIGYSDKKEKVVTFRVDRILKQPDILEEAAVKKSKDFDLTEYSNKIFKMFDGEEQEVELECENELMKNIIDQFGEDVDVIANNDNTFVVRVTVSVSSTFFGWVVGFGGKIKIAGPEEVKKDYSDLLNTIK